MIHMPRRSVTRFFIPLIDVMILLFCIFLLMPIFSAGANEGDDKSLPESDTFLADLERDRLTRRLTEARREVDTLRKQLDPLTKEERDLLARLKLEQGKPLHQRFAIFTLLIDGTNGQLYYFNPDANAKVVIGNKDAAARLIREERKQAGKRNLYFVLQEPRKQSDFPKRGQLKDYDTWFKEVPHGFQGAE